MRVLTRDQAEQLLGGLDPKDREEGEDIRRERRVRAEIRKHVPTQGFVQGMMAGENAPPAWAPKRRLRGWYRAENE